MRPRDSSQQIIGKRRLQHTSTGQHPPQIGIQQTHAGKEQVGQRTGNPGIPLEADPAGRQGNQGTAAAQPAEIFPGKERRPPGSPQEQRGQFARSGAAAVEARHEQSQILTAQRGQVQGLDQRRISR